MVAPAIARVAATAATSRTARFAVSAALQERNLRRRGFGATRRAFIISAPTVGPVGVAAAGLARRSEADPVFEAVQSQVDRLLSGGPGPL